jgi:hypothetical protein
MTRSAHDQANNHWHLRHWDAGSFPTGGGVTVSEDESGAQAGPGCISEEAALSLLAILEFITPSILAMMAQDQEDCAAELLERMREGRLADRVWLPEAAESSGYWVYFLTGRGAKVAGQLGKESVQQPRVDERTSLLLNHRIAVSQAAAGMMACVGSRRLQAAYLGRRLRRLLKDSTLKGSYFPDGYLAFSLDERHRTINRHVFLEVDLDTENRGQLLRKFRALDTYYLHDHRGLFGTDRLLVAVTTPTWRRLQQICSAVYEARSRVRVFANLQARVSAGDQALEGWIDCLTGQRMHLADIPRDAGVGDG